MPHERLERRGIALHRAVAAKLRAQPALLGIAHGNLDRWSNLSSGSQPYWDEWRKLLKLPLEELLAVIEEDSPRMRELRQSSPFAGVLEPKERWRVHDTFEPGTHNTSGRNNR